MFREEFYTIDSQVIEENSADFVVRWNASHPIFSGHFPGDPVTPGVCIVQTACNLVGLLLQRSVHVYGVKNAKFMQIIRPGEHPIIHFRLEIDVTDENFANRVKCFVYHEDIQFVKLDFTVK